MHPCASLSALDLHAARCHAPHLPELSPASTPAIHTLFLGHGRGRGQSQHTPHAASCSRRQTPRATTARSKPQTAAHDLAPKQRGRTSRLARSSTECTERPHDAYIRRNFPHRAHRRIPGPDLPKSHGPPCVRRSPAFFLASSKLRSPETRVQRSALSSLAHAMIADAHARTADTRGCLAPRRAPKPS